MADQAGNGRPGRAFLDQKPVHVHDILSAEGDEFPDGQEVSRRTGLRSVLSVPLLREGESIGAIALRAHAKYILSVINRLPYCRPLRIRR